MAIAHRTLSIFDSATDGRIEYVERLQFYFTANGIKGNSKKCATLLSSLWTGDILTGVEPSLSSFFNRLFVFSLSIKEESTLQTETVSYHSMVQVQFQAMFTLQVHIRVCQCTKKAYGIL